MAGKSPYEYIPAFNASLFLSANEDDVRKAIEAHYPAGVVLPALVAATWPAMNRETLPPACQVAGGGPAPSSSAAGGSGDR